MPKNPIVFTLDGRRCTCLLPEEKPKRLYVLCGWEMEKLMMLLAEDAPEVLFFSTEIDGGRDFTPWEAEPIWPGEPFSGGGEAYLKFLTDTALPYLEERFGAPTEPENCALLGYSLGGLFALWTLTKTEKFGAGASLSGSLWYPQFLKYLENCPPKKD
ncbi:alpha/beta hydrolase-fold protein, partial [Hominenteromicrobium sp.]